MSGPQSAASPGARRSAGREAARSPGRRGQALHDPRGLRPRQPDAGRHPARDRRAELSHAGARDRRGVRRRPRGLHALHPERRLPEPARAHRRAPPARRRLLPGARSDRRDAGRHERALLHLPGAAVARRRGSPADAGIPEHGRDGHVSSAAFRSSTSCAADDGFLPDLDELRSLVTPRTKAIFANTPGEPDRGRLPR